MFEYDTQDSLTFRETTQRLCIKEVPKFQIAEYAGTVPIPLFRAFGQAGLAGLAVPEELNGVAASAQTISAVIEEVAFADAGPAIFLSVHSMVCGLIAKFGDRGQKERFLPSMASGDSLGAFALTEPKAGSDASALTTRATRCQGGFKLSGEKCYITSAGFADIYLVFAKTSPDKGSKGISAFIVPKSTAGLTFGRPEKKMGAELSPIASLTFDQAFIPEDLLLGEIDSGYAVALGGLAGGRVNISACANGISRKAIDLALAHLKEREQFGSKLIDFQALQFILADLKIKLEASRLLTLKAALDIDRSAAPSAVRLSSSIAKCFSTDSAMAITTDAVQLLGGAGYLSDYGVEKLMRDAKMLQIVEGTNQIQRKVIAREMIGR